MTLTKKVFFGIAGFGGTLGLVLALYGVITPGATTVAVSGAEVTGITAFVAAIGSGLIPGVIFGAIGAGIAKLVELGANRNRKQG
ncbi:MAG: hypothetical protein GXP01_05400 [Alphaproteobacteria bacterium]|nr:hypothetical protein [Alphaproteobacteria bacterium]